MPFEEFYIRGAPENCDVIIQQSVNSFCPSNHLSNVHGSLSMDDRVRMIKMRDVNRWPSGHFEGQNARVLCLDFYR